MPCMHTRASDEMETVRCKECERNGKKKERKKKDNGNHLDETHDG